MKTQEEMKDDAEDQQGQSERSKPGFDHTDLKTAETSKLLQYEQELMKQLQKAKEPLMCSRLTVVENFDLTAYTSLPWYSQMQQPLIYNNLDTMKCVRADYRIKNNLPNGYDVQVYNQAVNIWTGERRGAGGDSGGMSLCSDQVDGAKLRVSPCDINPDISSGPYWVIHYEEGADGFAIVAGGDPYLPVKLNEDLSWVCGYLGLLTNNSGLWVLSRKQKATEATMSRARKIIEEAGLPWEIMAPVDHSDCDYLEVDP
jgi:lipocalin